MHVLNVAGQQAMDPPAPIQYNMTKDEPHIGGKQEEEQEDGRLQYYTIQAKN